VVNKPIREEKAAVKRVQMDMPLKSFERLQRLQGLTEASSYTEVVKNALRLYEALVDEAEKGNEFLLKSGDDVAPFRIFSA
jgi:hypothetical protein